MSGRGGCWRVCGVLRGRDLLACLSLSRKKHGLGARRRLGNKLPGAHQVVERISHGFGLKALAPPRSQILAPFITAVTKCSLSRCRRANSRRSIKVTEIMAPQPLFCLLEPDCERGQQKVAHDQHIHVATGVMFAARDCAKDERSRNFRYRNPRSDRPGSDRQLNRSGLSLNVADPRNRRFASYR